MNNRSVRRSYPFLAAGTVLVSAFLLFQVQPMISKMILPWYGGSPAVWTTCMLFFQTFLLAGYAYAHGLTRRARNQQIAVHLLLLAIACCLLPAIPAESTKPSGSEDPVLSILTLLTRTVGLPYLALAATGPLLQAWFHQVERRTPYRLYALSNAGSLVALLSYPFLFEPAFDTTWQGGLWSLGFVVFAMGCATIAVLTGRFSGAAVTDELQPSAAEGPSPEPDAGNVSGDPPRATGRRNVLKRDVLGWFLLPALATMTLLAFTNHVCQDVAVVPFLWVIPLSLYLVTFIICFDHARWYRPTVFSLATIVLLSIPAIEHRRTWFGGWPIPGWNYLLDLDRYVVMEASIYLAGLFVLCMVCHGQLYRLRPASEKLTLYFLMISAGGAMGGMFVALICPQIFVTFFESTLCMILGVALACGALIHQHLRTWPLRSVAYASIAMLFTVAWLGYKQPEGSQGDKMVLDESRSFYGVLRTVETGSWSPETHRRELYHGRIVHGIQLQNPALKMKPSSYYSEYSGIGMAFDFYKRHGAMRVGVLGLGTGSIVAHGRQEDYFRFYEINPQVVRMAREYFTYLTDTSVTTDVILGDGRLSLEGEPPQQFDLIAVDAFTGDAIPTHLLTVEAMQVYRRHLAPGGTIAFNVSNRHLRVEPVITGIARSVGMDVRDILNSGGRSAHDVASEWVLVSQNPALFEDSAILESGRRPADPPEGLRLWTDRYSNLFELLR